MAVTSTQSTTASSSSSAPSLTARVRIIDSVACQTLLIGSASIVGNCLEVTQFTISPKSAPLGSTFNGETLFQVNNQTGTGMSTSENFSLTKYFVSFSFSS